MVPTVPPLAAATAAPQTFQKYCVECHGAVKPEAGLNLDALTKQATVGEHAQEWERVAEMLETRMMPPDEATSFPTDAGTGRPRRGSARP